MTAADLARSLVYFDNGGRTADRYTAVMPDGDALAMSDRPNHPQGVCSYLGLLGRPDGEQISFEQLPQPVRAHVTDELAAYYGGYLDGGECGSCGALLAPSTAYPWHLPDEDCRAIRHPKED